MNRLKKKRVMKEMVPYKQKTIKKTKKINKKVKSVNRYKILTFNKV